MNVPTTRLKKLTRKTLNWLEVYAKDPRNFVDDTDIANELLTLVEVANTARNLVSYKSEAPAIFIDKIKELVE